MQGLPAQASPFTEGEAEIHEEWRFPKSGIQAGRVNPPWTPKFQLAVSWSVSWDIRGDL